MARILVVYGSSHGQTHKVATRVGYALLRHGHVVTVMAADEAARHAVGAAAFDAVAVGARVRFGRVHPDVARFVADNATELARRPSAFFTVCLAVTKGAAGEAETAALVDRFLRRHGWTPPLRANFAGALRYTAYGHATRWAVRRIARAGGLASDITRDHEYTDWAAVDRFADEVLALPGVKAAHAVTAAP